MTKRTFQIYRYDPDKDDKPYMQTIDVELDGSERMLLDEGVTAIAALRERVKNIHLGDKSKVFNTARIEALEVENLIEVAQATIVSAAARKECRGAHVVVDYEEPADSPKNPLGRNDVDWLKHTLWFSADNRLDYKPVKLKPLTTESIPLAVRSF